MTDAGAAWEPLLGGSRCYVNNGLGQDTAVPCRKRGFKAKAAARLPGLQRRSRLVMGCEAGWKVSREALGAFPNEKVFVEHLLALLACTWENN